MRGLVISNAHSRSLESVPYNYILFIHPARNKRKLQRSCSPMAATHPSHCLLSVVRAQVTPKGITGVLLVGSSPSVFRESILQINCDFLKNKHHNVLA